MELTAQIPDVTVGRAANAPHYEYMTTFGKRTAELPVDHELWCKGKDEFDTAFRAEDEAGKRTPLTSETDFRPGSAPRTCASPIFAQKQHPAHDCGETERMKQQIKRKKYDRCNRI